MKGMDVVRVTGPMCWRPLDSWSYPGLVVVPSFLFMPPTTIEPPFSVWHASRHDDQDVCDWFGEVWVLETEMEMDQIMAAC